ncbi:MazG nucleotide pyrophosphohydrolase domain-containing protein [Mesomycoplasma molare]|uniref:Nucleotide pyrophosphohydrolase n=1 Tax=Mesomycoplasma molare TaxID=171288 RepID=A0ABY5TYE2_9BACT|nr:MazG nucleotide pyrophosphohydrolase domain-containing protein [Mesomycoplasma molare]UWD34253.1 nucleotide pyrophosphohydrolase [Mesomycoplasma molare]
MKKELTIKQLQEYLYEIYKNKANNVRMLTKLTEEVGEVAEAIAIKEGWKQNKQNVSLEEELADIIHYTVALASINNINLSEVIIRKDKEAAKRYEHEYNLEEFIKKNK